jgi:small subunit ribosomal protein S3
VQAAPPEVGGGVTQAPPAELPSRAGAPILPPMAPPQPSWKQEVRQDQPPQETEKPQE